MDLDVIMPSDMSHRERQKLYVIKYIDYKTQMNI